MMTDKFGPQWVKRIDLQNLVLSVGHSCIVGQYFGSYRHGLEVLGCPSESKEGDFDWTYEHGFEERKSIDGVLVDWDELTEEWKRVLQPAVVERTRTKIRETVPA